MEKELWKQEKDLLYLFQMKIWMILLNHKINRAFRCINWWSYWNNKTWNQKQEDGFLGAFLASLAASVVQLVISSAVKGISGIGGRRAGRGYMNKNFSSTLSFKQYRDY